MNVYIRRGPFGLRLGCLGTLSVGLVYAAIWLPVALFYALFMGLAQIVIQTRKLLAQRRQEATAAGDLRVQLAAMRDRGLAAAETREQRAELERWYAVGLPAYARWKAGGSLRAWKLWAEARGELARIRAWRFGSCSNCGALEQRLRRPCRYCSELVTETA